MSLFRTTKVLNSFNSTPATNESLKIGQNKKLNILKEIFIKWSLKSTCYAYASIFRVNKIYLKLTWLILLIISFSFCCFTILKSILAYLDFEVTTKIRMIPDKPILFPVVSFCNINPFITNKGYQFVLDHFNKKFNQNFESFDQILENVLDLNSEYEYLMQMSADEMFAKEIKQSFGFSLEESILVCRFNRNKCNLSEFEWFYSTTFGNCFKFNSGFDINGHKIPLKYLQSPGMESGLMLEIFAGMQNASKPIFSYWENAGLKVNIFNQSISPGFDEGLEVPIGYTTNINIRKQIILNEPRPYSICENFKSSFLVDYIKSTNKIYRQKDCFELCYQMLTIEKCGCYDLYYPRLNGSRPCYLNEKEYECLVSSYLDFFDRDNRENCSGQCPLECESISYETKISHSDFPSRAYAKKLLKSIKIFANENSKIDYNILRENVLNIKIYFEDLKYTLISEKPKILVEDLLATIGGTLSLFIGISILSLGELVELVVQILKLFLSQNIDDDF